MPHWQSFNMSPNCNIRQHALDFDHPIKLENFKLANKSNKYEIKIVESTLIHELGPMGARTEKAFLPARATGTNLLPELRYIKKSSAH